VVPHASIPTLMFGDIVIQDEFGNPRREQSVPRCTGLFERRTNSIEI